MVKAAIKRVDLMCLRGDEQESITSIPGLSCQFRAGFSTGEPQFSDIVTQIITPIKGQFWKCHCFDALKAVGGRQPLLSGRKCVEMRVSKQKSPVLYVIPQVLWGLSQVGAGRLRGLFRRSVESVLPLCPLDFS